MFLHANMQPNGENNKKNMQVIIYFLVSCK